MKVSSVALTMLPLLINRFKEEESAQEKYGDKVIGRRRY